jgi:hypothetical protein
VKTVGIGEQGVRPTRIVEDCLCDGLRFLGSSDNVSVSMFVIDVVIHVTAATVVDFGIGLAWVVFRGARSCSRRNTP